AQKSALTFEKRLLYKQIEKGSISWTACSPTLDILPHLSTTYIILRSVFPVCSYTSTVHAYGTFYVYNASDVGSGGGSRRHGTTNDPLEVIVVAALSPTVVMLSRREAALTEENTNATRSVESR